MILCPHSAEVSLTVALQCTWNVLVIASFSELRRKQRQLWWCHILRTIMKCRLIIISRKNSFKLSYPWTKSLTCSWSVISVRMHYLDVSKYEWEFKNFMSSNWRRLLEESGAYAMQCFPGLENERGHTPSAAWNGSQPIDFLGYWRTTFNKNQLQ